MQFKIDFMTAISLECRIEYYVKHETIWTAIKHFSEKFDIGIKVELHIQKKNISPMKIIFDKKNP